PLEADPGEGSRARARPGAGTPSQAAFGAQQLPDAAGAVRDAEQPLPDGLRTQLLVADPRGDDGDRGLDPALLQPAARGTDGVGDPRHGGAGDRGRGGGDPPE